LDANNSDSKINEIIKLLIVVLAAAILLYYLLSVYFFSKFNRVIVGAKQLLGKLISWILFFVLIALQILLPLLVFTVEDYGQYILSDEARSLYLYICLPIFSLVYLLTIVFMVKHNTRIRNMAAADNDNDYFRSDFKTVFISFLFIFVLNAAIINFSGDFADQIAMHYIRIFSTIFAYSAFMFCLTTDKRILKFLFLLLNLLCSIANYLIFSLSTPAMSIIPFTILSAITVFFVLLDVIILRKKRIDLG
jgi:hypothetical protein